MFASCCRGDTFIHQGGIGRLVNPTILLGRLTVLNAMRKCHADIVAAREAAEDDADTARIKALRDEIDALPDHVDCGPARGGLVKPFQWVHSVGDLCMVMARQVAAL